MKAARSTAEKQVVRAAAKAASARQELAAAIRTARSEGLPLRTIAQAAGMSHEQVRRLSSL